MASRLRLLPALVLTVSPAVMAAGDYVGVLRPTAKPAAIAIPEPGFYWPLAGTLGGGLGPEVATAGMKLRLGYRYSRFLSVEAGYADFGAKALAPFSGVTSRGRGYSLETVGTIPLWTRVSLYGRFGAWRSEVGAGLLAGADGIARPGTGLRYGLGLKYDLNRRVGFQAEMEH